MGDLNKERKSKGEDVLFFFICKDQTRIKSQQKRNGPVPLNSSVVHQSKLIRLLQLSAPSIVQYLGGKMRVLLTTAPNQFPESQSRKGACQGLREFPFCEHAL